MPVEWPKQNSHYVSSAKGLGRPRRQETRNVDNKTERKTGNASTESGLPFLTMTINEMANTQFSHRTQELRLQMMQQTGSLVGLHNSVNSTRKFDMGGTLDAMLDTINSRVEENPYSYDKNIKGPPWYLPTLNLHQLTQCCCRPNSRPLFGPLDGDRLSTICHCSGASHQNSKKTATSTLTRKRRPSSPRNRSDDVGNCEKVDKVYLLRGRKRFRELTYLQRLLLEQWCRTISDVSCRERLELDPTKLHDKVMKEVRRDEHTVQLFEQVQKHERMQEREYTRQIQRLEDERMYGANDARYGFAIQSDWRSLLTSWDKGTACAGESAYSASQGSQDGSTPSKIVNSPRAPTRNTFVTVGEGTHTGVCPRRAQGFLAGPYHVPGLLGRPMHRSNVGYQLRNSGADEENIPLQELQKLLVAVKDGSLMNAVSASRKGARSHRLDAGLLYERAGRNTIFALPITFYMDSNWLECIIFDDDLPAVKLITQKLQEHISSKSSQGAKNMSPFSLAKCSYGVFRAPRHLQALSESNDPQSLLKAFMEGNQRPHDLEGASLFLLPLRLCVADAGLPPRVVMTDAASVVSVRKKGSIATIPSSVFTNHKGHGYDTSGKRAAVSKEGIVPPLNLCKYLAGADVSGRALCASEHLTNYSVELQIVIKQSAWRSTTLKQLANEEYDHLKRKILAKVFVMLAMSNAMIEHERRRESVSYVTAQTLSGDATVDATPTLLSMPRTKRVAVHSLALPPVTSYPGSVEDSNLEFSLSDFVLPLTCAYEYTTQVDVYAAPTHRDHYVVDAKHLFCVAATALEETNNSILPALARLATEYRCQYSRLARMAEEDVCKTTVSCSSGFTLDDSKRASAHLSGALELLKLESDYSKLLVTLLRNESTIIYYNLHHLPHYRFIQQRKLLWGHLYLRTLRLAYAFCVLVQELGLFPIPPKYRPFLRPVLLLLEYHGGQEELRSRAEETLLELEMRANELGAMLCRKEVTTHYMPELDAAATVVAEGEYSVSRFISCLASPDDVLSPVLLPVDLPQQLFSDVPSIAGYMCGRRLNSGMMTLRSSTSLQSDLSRFIFPLARSLRHDKVSGAVTDASPVGSVTASGRHNAAEYVKPEGFCKSHQRTPGVRKTVTYFSPHMNALLNRPFGSTGTIDTNVPLYQCPICSCGSSAEGDIKRHMQPWMDPQEMTRHMSWLHASSGYTQSNFSIYNAGEMRRLCKSLPCSSADDPREETAMKPRVVLMLDVANIELSLEDVLIQLLTSEESILFFSRVACAIVCVHEVFIPHTSRPGHIFFQLSRLNALSDIFTLYAATRIESGDLLTAALMGELLFQDMRGCAPSIVLLTRDQQQKLCVSNMFSGVAGRGARVFLPRITAQSILCCLREANLASMGL